MKKIFASLLSAALIAGCATHVSHLNISMEKGDFVVAYKLGIVRGEKINDRSAFVSQIKTHPLGFSTDKFFNSARADINSGYRSESSFVDLAKLINMAEIDGLITNSQAKILRGDLIYAIDSESASSPDLAKSTALKASLPDLGSPAAKYEIFKSKIKVIAEKQGSKLGEIVPLLSFSSTVNDEKFLADLKNLGSWLAEGEFTQLSASTTPISYSAVSSLVHFANFNRSPEFSDRVKSLLTKVSFSRANLNSVEMRDFDSEFVKKELASRIIKFKVVIEPDDGAFHEDLTKLLPEKNEWVELDDDSKNILLVKRQRFLENMGTPSNGTEIVPDPSFGTLLFIPQNASVLFDYVTTEYRIDYSIDASISIGNKKNNIRGSDTLKRTECRNIRYQNVFGGVGSIGWYPSDRVQYFCTSSNGATFDSLKKRVIEKIASDINSAILTK